MTIEELANIVIKMGETLGKRIDGVENQITELRTDVNQIRTDVNELRTDLNNVIVKNNLIT